jgi:hypothetical protein
MTRRTKKRKRRFRDFARQTLNRRGLYIRNYYRQNRTQFVKQNKIYPNWPQKEAGQKDPSTANRFLLDQFKFIKGHIRAKSKDEKPAPILKRKASTELADLADGGQEPGTSTGGSTGTSTGTSTAHKRCRTTQADVVNTLQAEVVFRRSDLADVLDSVQAKALNDKLDSLLADRQVAEGNRVLWLKWQNATALELHPTLWQRYMRISFEALEILATKTKELNSGVMQAPPAPLSSQV